MREREKSSSLSERYEEEEEEESEADGGGDSGVLEDVGVTSSRGGGHIVARAAQVLVTAENILVLIFLCLISDLEVFIYQN